MPQQDGAAYWLYTVLVSSRVQRDALLTGLAQEGIEARPLWQPIHMQPPYQDCKSAGSITVATDLYERAVSLPSSVGLTDQELQRCVNAVTSLCVERHVLR